MYFLTFRKSSSSKKKIGKIKYFRKAVGSVLFKARHDWLHVVMEERSCTFSSGSYTWLNEQKCKDKDTDSFIVIIRYAKWYNLGASCRFRSKQHLTLTYIKTNLHSCLHSVAKKH